MYPTIPGLQDCAAHCYARIELVPSSRAAILWFAWLVLVDLTVLLATTLNVVAALVAGTVLLTLGVAGVRLCCLLTTAGAVHVVGWSDDGRWQVWVGPRRQPLEVRLAEASFRLGDCAFLLWFKSCDGIHAVLIDVKRQHPAAIRRLARHLNRGSERGADEPATPS